MIKDNIDKIKKRIKGVCSRIDCDPEEIVLVGISKYADVSLINEAITAGLTHIGENRVLEAKQKFSEIITGRSVIRHMVGHLQTNKVKTAVEIFDLIESVDSIKLALEIQKQAEKLEKKVSVLAQINVSGEAQKSGMAPDEVDEFIKQVRGLDHLYLQGLMTIGPLTEDHKVVRACFRNLKEIFEKTKNKYHSDQRFEMKYLSMGMSGDFEMAIEEGANMIRIGRAIFHGE